jgi:hypothetical protein
VSIETERGKKVGPAKAAKSSSYIVQRTVSNRTVVRDAKTGRFVSHSNLSDKSVTTRNTTTKSGSRKTTQGRSDSSPAAGKGKKKR